MSLHCWLILKRISEMSRLIVTLSVNHVHITLFVHTNNTFGFTSFPFENTSDNPINESS